MADAEHRVYQGDVDGEESEHRPGANHSEQDARDEADQAQHRHKQEKSARTQAGLREKHGVKMDLSVGNCRCIRFHLCRCRDRFSPDIHGIRLGSARRA